MVLTGDVIEVCSFLDELNVPDMVNEPLNLNGSTCLIFANKHLELTKALIARGAKVNVGNKYKKTPALYAAQGGHTEVLFPIHDLYMNSFPTL